MGSKRTESGMCRNPQFVWGVGNGPSRTLVATDGTSIIHLARFLPSVSFGLFYFATKHHNHRETMYLVEGRPNRAIGILRWAICVDSLESFFATLSLFRTLLKKANLDMYTGIQIIWSNRKARRLGYPSPMRIESLAKATACRT